MVKYVIIRDEKDRICHEITRLAIFKNKDVGGFIQEQRYWYEDKEEKQYTIPLSHEDIERLRKGLEAI